MDRLYCLNACCMSESAKEDDASNENENRDSAASSVHQGDEFHQSTERPQAECTNAVNAENVDQERDETGSSAETEKQESETREPATLNAPTVSSAHVTPTKLSEQSAAFLQRVQQKGSPGTV